MEGQWTFLDLIFAVIILISTVLALTKGLMREIISLVSLLGGFLLAAFYYWKVASFLVSFTKTQDIANLLGFLTIFVGILLLGAAASFLVNRFLKKTSLEWADRLLGGVYGLLRGWLIASIIVLALIAFTAGGNALARSILAPYLLTGARVAVVMVPQQLKDRFYEEYRKVMESLSTPSATQKSHRRDAENPERE